MYVPYYFKYLITTILISFRIWIIHVFRIKLYRNTQNPYLSFMITCTIPSFNYWYLFKCLIKHSIPGEEGLNSVVFQLEFNLLVHQLSVSVPVIGLSPLSNTLSNAENFPVCLGFRTFFPVPLGVLTPREESDLEPRHSCEHCISSISIASLGILV